MLHWKWLTFDSSTVSALKIVDIGRIHQLMYAWYVQTKWQTNVNSLKVDFSSFLSNDNQEYHMLPPYASTVQVRFCLVFSIVLVDFYFVLSFYFRQRIYWWYKRSANWMCDWFAGVKGNGIFEEHGINMRFTRSLILMCCFCIWHGFHKHFNFIFVFVLFYFILFLTLIFQVFFFRFGWKEANV